MTMDIVIKNGYICAEQKIINGGLAISNGIIQFIGSDESLPDAREIYDAKGNIIFPGAIECHGHFGLCEFTRESFEREMETETKAAAQGGITTVNTTTLFGANPLSDLLEWAHDGADRLYANVKFYVAPGSEGHIDEIPQLVKKGVSGFKFLLGYRGEGAKAFGMVETGIDTGYMYRAFSKIAQAGYPAFAMIHAEDPAIIETVTPTVSKQKTNNLIDAWQEARPSICEVIDLCKAAYIANEVGCRLYQVHVSAKESVDQIAYFQAKGYDVVAETCPHYLVLSSDDKEFIDNEELCILSQVQPPIRQREDQERLWQGLREGTIKTIGTDHLAYSRALKLEGKDFWTTIPGVGPSMNVSLPLLFSEGVNKGRITLDTLSKVMCENPARVWGLYPKKGTLSVGSDADITIIDPDKEMVIDCKDSESSGEFSIYQRRRVKGVPVATFVNGNLVAENYKIVAKEPYGKVLTTSLRSNLEMI